LKKNCYCTYFNHAFSPYGLTLIESICRHDPSAYLFILCLDRDTFEFLSKSTSDRICLINLHTLEEAIPELLEPKSNRTIIEYYWTLTPCILYYLIFQTKVCSKLTYLDADQYFYADPQPIFEEIGDASISIMPHRFPDEINELNTHGKFNVSWLTFRNTVEARECLMWWMSSCIEWCYAKVDGSRYGDQKYLDQFSSQFQGVHEIQHKGCGLAPWNLSTFNYDCEIILFHFQSFRIRSPYLFTAVIHLIGKSDLKQFKEKILKKYLFSLRNNFVKIKNSCTYNGSDKSIYDCDNSLFILYLFNNVIFLKHKFVKKVFLFFYDNKILNIF
jgi:hypothetical protein